jgi:hypothetical protein
LINAADLASQITFAREIAPQFDINKWIVASRYLEGNCKILEAIFANLEVVKDIMHSESLRFGGDQASGVLTGDQF